MRELEIKKRLMDLVIANLDKKSAVLDESKSRAQADAKDHTNEYGSLYDNFKETSNALQAGYLRQIQKLQEVLSMMRQLPLKIAVGIEPGCVVTDAKGAYFISTGLVDEAIELDGVQYACINLNAPIVQKLREIKDKKIF